MWPRDRQVSGPCEDPLGRADVGARRVGAGVPRSRQCLPCPLTAGPCRRRPSGRGRLRRRSGRAFAAFGLVPQAVVEAAQQAPVLLGRLAARCKRVDVVSLAHLGRSVAIGMSALPVAQLQGSSGPACEEAGPSAHLHPTAQLEDGPFEVSRVHPRVERRGRKRGSVETSGSWCTMCPG